jgi:hypothetical protein
VPESIDFPLLGNEELIVAMLIALFVGFAFLFKWLLGVLDARLPQGRALPVYAVMVALGALMGLPLLFFTFVSEDACGCEPAFAIGGFVLAMAVATLALWVARAADRLNAQWLLRLRIAGYATAAGTLVTGAIRFLSDVSEIL